MLTKYFRKNNLPFLPFLLSNEKKMLKKNVSFFLRFQNKIVTIMLSMTKKTRISYFF